METCEIWWEQPAQLTGEASVVDVTLKQGKQAIILDKSLFYPEGGGQPGDKGVIIGANGTMTVEDTRKIEGVCCHLGTIVGEIKNRRFSNSAGECGKKNI